MENIFLGRLKKLISSLEHSRIQYLVFAGYGLDGKRGFISRFHEDIDIFCLKFDLSKIENIMKKLNYKFVENVNDLYKFHQSKDLKIDFCFLNEKKKQLVSILRFVKLNFPKELFFNPQRGKIENIEFNIASNEMLKKWGLYSKKGTDAKLQKLCL